MAEGEFGFDVEFGHSLVFAAEIEERVVAEAIGASGTAEYFAFYGAVADGQDFAVARCGEDAVVAGGWMLVGDFAESFEEAEVVALVCG